MDYAQMKAEKDARFKEYNETYSEQLRLLGYIEAVSEAAAIERAVVPFPLDEERSKRLAVNLRRPIVVA